MIEPLLQAERLLIVGMLDQAEQIYRRVAEQDPRNAIAVMGLARVALERGEEEAALAHARAALEIDQDNPAALRLEARLREVLAQRTQQAVPVETGGESDQSWVSTAAAAGPDARPSEQFVFTRNPSMTDHRRMEKPIGEHEPGQERPQRRRPGLIARLLGRRE